MKPARVLVVDDEVFVRESLQALLEARGYEVVAASGGEEAAIKLQTEDVDVVLTDMKMPAGDGNALLRAARDEGIDVPILVLSGATTVGEAVTAMKVGAYDLLEKPVEPAKLCRALERAVERHRLRSEVAGLRATLRLPADGRRWIAHSAAAKRVAAAVERAARSEAPVLLTGPSGVGKAVVAEELHRAGERGGRPFVRVDCAALGPERVAAVVFGARRGAVPGVRAERIGRIALARGGTLVLDEVGALSLDVQGRLLDLLEAGEYARLGEDRSRHADVRVVVTTNQRLRARVDAGAFREDLYWRLDVLRIDVPTLELRREDLPALARALTVELWRGDAPAPPVSEEALGLLESYSWPGNVHELRSVLERALLIRGVEPDAGPLDAEVVGGALDSQLGAGGRLASAAPSTVVGDDLRIRANLLTLERKLLIEAIARTAGRRAEAADLLGVDARNLGYYFRKHRITEDELDRAARG